MSHEKSYLIEFGSIIGMLNYFVRKKSYSFVDRMSFALNTESIISALNEALRTARTIHSSSSEREKPPLPSNEEVERFIQRLDKEGIKFARKISALAYAEEVGA